MTKPQLAKLSLQLPVQQHTEQTMATKSIKCPRKVAKTPRYQPPYPTTDDKMFHLFRNLPQELQDKIWDHAIQNRQSEPLAHFFTLDEEAIHKQRQLLKVDSRGSLEWTQVLSQFGPPPKHGDDMDGRYWSKTFDGCPDRKSGHLLDSGLWGACVESRAAVVRRWKLHHGLSCCLGYNYSSDRDSCPGLDANSDWSSDDEETKVAYLPCGYQNIIHFKNPYRVTIWRGPHQNLPDERWIVTRPEMDLFVCDIPDLNDFNGSELHMLQLSTANVQWVANIGIEYSHWWPVPFFITSESWRQIMRRSNPTGSIARMLDNAIHTGNKTARLCLIDYDSKPATGKTLQCLLTDRKVFRAQGQRFIEVRCKDIGRTWKDGMDQRRRLREAPVHDFLRLLILAGQYHYYCERDGVTLKPKGDPVRRKAKEVFDGLMVLAVLEDGYVFEERTGHVSQEEGRTWQMQDLDVFDD